MGILREVLLNNATGSGRRQSANMQNRPRPIPETINSVPPAEVGMPATSLKPAFSDS